MYVLTQQHKFCHSLQLLYCFPCIQLSVSANTFSNFLNVKLLHQLCLLMSCFTFYTYEIMTSIFQLTFRFHDFHILYVSNNMNRLEIKIYLIQMLIVKHVLRYAIYAYKYQSWMRTITHKKGNMLTNNCKQPCCDTIVLYTRYNTDQTK